MEESREQLAVSKEELETDQKVSQEMASNLEKRLPESVRDLTASADKVQQLETTNAKLLDERKSFETEIPQLQDSLAERDDTRKKLETDLTNAQQTISSLRKDHRSQGTVRKLS